MSTKQTLSWLPKFHTHTPPPSAGRKECLLQQTTPDCRAGALDKSRPTDLIVRWAGPDSPSWLNHSSGRLTLVQLLTANISSEVRWIPPELSFWGSILPRWVLPYCTETINKWLKEKQEKEKSCGKRFKLLMGIEISGTLGSLTQGQGDFSLLRTRREYNSRSSVLIYSHISELCCVSHTVYFLLFNSSEIHDLCYAKVRVN